LASNLRKAHVTRDSSCSPAKWAISVQRAIK